MVKHGPLVWSDEFEGTELDTSKWRWEPTASMAPVINEELQHYTGRNDNTTRVVDGQLVLSAARDPQSAAILSARISTYGLFSFTYGVVEARMKAPYRKGFWPAFWMLGASVHETGWPACGEVDIMEVFGHRKGRAGCSTVHNSLHSWGTRDPLDGGCAPLGPPLDDEDDDAQPGWHTWWARWTPDRISFFLDDDDQPLWSYDREADRTDSRAHEQYPYSRPFYFILNLAVGGNGPGEGPKPTDLEPPGTALLVDYVRVYALDTDRPLLPPTEASPFLPPESSPSVPHRSVKLTSAVAFGDAVGAAARSAAVGGGEFPRGAGSAGVGAISVGALALLVASLVSLLRRRRVRGAGSSNSHAWPYRLGEPLLEGRANVDMSISDAVAREQA